MKYLLGIFFILVISQVCAVCESGQIDINSASLTKLDELGGIGPVKAQAIIDTRPFDSVEDLIDVYGIGKITLEKIKDQGLACVNNEKDEPEELEQVDFVKEVPSYLEKTEPLIPQIVETKKEDKPEIITLNSQTKDIKSDDTKKKLDKSDWAKYGFIGFCVLLGFLFILKKRKAHSEFD